MERAVTIPTPSPVAAEIAKDKAAAEKLLTEAKRVREALDQPGLLGRYIPGWDSWEDVEKAATRYAALVAALEAVLALADELSDAGMADGAEALCAQEIREAIESALRDTQGDERQ